MNKIRLYITLCGDPNNVNKFEVTLNKQPKFSSIEGTPKINTCQHQDTQFFYYIIDNDKQSLDSKKLYPQFFALASKHHLSICLYEIDFVADKMTIQTDDEQPFFNPVVKNLFLLEQVNYFIDNRYPMLAELLRETYSHDQVNDFANGHVDKWVDARLSSAIYHQYQTEIWQLLITKMAKYEEDPTLNDFPDIPIDSIKCDLDFRR